MYLFILSDCKQLKHHFLFIMHLDILNIIRIQDIPHIKDLFLKPIEFLTRGYYY